MAVRTLHNSNEISALAVAAKRSCAPQWRAFMEALGSALPEITGDEMALRLALFVRHQRTKPSTS